MTYRPWSSKLKKPSGCIHLRLGPGPMAPMPSDESSAASWPSPPDWASSETAATAQVTDQPENESAFGLDMLA